MADEKPDDVAPAKLTVPWESMEKWAKSLPLLALVAAGAYALGMLVCWISDSQFGVGLSGVPKERALAAGFACLLSAVPTGVGIGACSKLKSGALKANLIITILTLFGTFLTAGVVTLAFHLVGGVMPQSGNQGSPNTKLMLTQLMIPWALILVLFIKVSVGSSKSYTTGMAVFGSLMFVNLFGSLGLRQLSAPFGGYNNQRVTVSTSRAGTFNATLLATDGQSTLLATPTDYVRVSTSDVIEIRTRRTDVNADHPLASGEQSPPKQ